MHSWFNQSTLASIILFTAISANQAFCQDAVRETNGRNSGGGGKPAQNRNCDVAAARQCQAEAKSLQAGCQVGQHLTPGCYDQVLLGYAICKEQAGCR